MNAMATTPRRTERTRTAVPSVVRILTHDGSGSSQWLTAKVVDSIAGGFGLTLTIPLRPGSIVVVHGTWSKDGVEQHLRAAVRWCMGKPEGTFRAGLEFLILKSGENQRGSSSFETPTSSTPDGYEVMQLSPNADTKTISRAYRMLASRYHPDNAATGNHEKFIRLCEAYEILSNPEKRAGYDVRRRDAARLRSKCCSMSPGKLPGWDAAVKALFSPRGRP
jgi:hypothetical protein